MKFNKDYFSYYGSFLGLIVYLCLLSIFVVGFISYLSGDGFKVIVHMNLFNEGFLELFIVMPIVGFFIFSNVYFQIKR